MRYGFASQLAIARVGLYLKNAILYIHRRQLSHSLVLVFDEFPYLANINTGILSILQHLVDHTLRNGKLFFVLCGSYMGFMEKEVLGAKSPLLGGERGAAYEAFRLQDVR